MAALPAASDALARYLGQTDLMTKHNYSLIFLKLILFKLCFVEIIPQLRSNSWEVFVMECKVYMYIFLGVLCSRSGKDESRSLQHVWIAHGTTRTLCNCKGGFSKVLLSFANFISIKNSILLPKTHVPYRISFSFRHNVPQFHWILSIYTHAALYINCFLSLNLFWTVAFYMCIFTIVWGFLW